MQTHKMQLLRKNICFPYINNKNLPKLSIKTVFQPEPMHSNPRELSASSDAALFLQPSEAVSFSVSYAYRILCFIMFPGKVP